MFYGINSYQKQNILVLKLVKYLLYIEFELKRKLKTILKTDQFLVIKKGGFQMNEVKVVYGLVKNENDEILAVHNI